MRRFLTLLIAALISATATTQIGAFASKPPHHLQQAPIMAQQSDVAKDDFEPQFGGSPLISDVMPRSRQIGIFSELTREVSLVSNRLESSTSNATVLAPSDTAMRQLKRRPWEDPEDYKKFGASAYEGEDGPERVQKNLERFVGAHVVPQSPWKAGEKVKTLAGNEVWFEEKGDDKVIQPAGVKVTQVADKVANGEVWILDSILNPVLET